VPNPIQDSAEIVINCSQGNKVLTRVKSIEPKDERKLEFQNFVGNNGRPGGVKETPGGIVLTITETPSIPEEVDWKKLRDDREWFSISTQGKGGGKLGKREQYVPCRVSEVSSPKVNDQGEVEREIIVFALDLKDL
jgi:hypothetical protein